MTGLISKADMFFTIPISEKAESLNVNAALTVTLFKIRELLDG